MTVYDGNRYDGWNEYVTYGLSLIHIYLYPPAIHVGIAQTNYGKRQRNGGIA